MNITIIDGILFKNMIIAGSNNLEKNREVLNALNVFPVPDGDTGNNMALTVLAAAKEVSKSNNPNIADVAKATSSGALRGARGNSGVIVSQLFRGISKGMAGKDVADAKVLVDSFVISTETAYKAVMKPKEGTILTVARAVSERAVEIFAETDDLEVILKEMIKSGYEMLEKTTDMLPALKQANVVDSGGKGLMCILDGMYEALLSGKEYKLEDVSEANMADANVMGEFNTEDIKFAYCTEFFVNTDKTSEKMEMDIKQFLGKLGDSIVVVCDDDIIKIHVHTNDPGKVLDRAVTVGELSNIKIENMKLQHSTLINFSKPKDEQKEEPTPQAERTEIGFISIVSGDGLADAFKNLGVNEIISGGQTMNPSTEDILKAVENVNSDNVIIFPNNSNIILAAEQAAKISSNTDKNVFVIPSKTVPQGISSLVKYMPSENIDDVINAMNDSLKEVKTGSITFAVRDTVIDDKTIAEGDILCMNESKINNVAKNIDSGAKQLIDDLIDDETSFVSIYYGEDITEDDANNLLSFLEEKYDDIDFELNYGGQPLYYYVISVE